MVYSVIASDSGWSELLSIDDNISKNSFLEIELSIITLTTLGLPSVIVPVLSNTIVLISWVVSNIYADLNNIPFSAAFPGPTIIAVGVASPRAQGQEITNTAIPIDNENDIPYPSISHTIVDIIAIAMTVGTKM